MARISKADWIRRGLEVLSEEGYHAIRIDWLCEKFKITKGSFYHHFESLEDYERQLFKYWEKETLPGASSLQRCRRKQRCISIIIWESRSASARNCAVVGSASVASNFTAVKLRGEMNVSTAGIVI